MLLEAQSAEIKEEISPFNENILQTLFITEQKLMGLFLPSTNHYQRRL